MDAGIRDLSVILLALGAAILVETLCWTVVARVYTQTEHARTWVGAVAALTVGVTTFIGPSRLDLIGRTSVAAVTTLGYAYARGRIYLPVMLARLGRHLAGRVSTEFETPRVTDPRRLRREQRFVTIGLVITLVGPVMSAILYPEARKYALVWAAVVAISACILLGLWYVASRRS